MTEGTRKTPFSFSLELREFQKSFDEYLRVLLEQKRREWISPENVQGYHHGLRWRSHYAADSERIDEMRSHVQEVVVKHESILSNDVSVLIDAIDSLAERIHEQIMRMMFDVVTQSTEETGNVVSAKGKPFPQSFLEVLDKIEFGVDRNGEPTLPSLFVPPGAAERIFDELSSQGEEFERKVEELKEKKIAAALAKERERISRFKVPDDD